LQTTNALFEKLTCLLPKSARKVTEKDNLQLAKMIQVVFEEHEAPKVELFYSDPTTNNLLALFKHNKFVFWVAETDSES